MSLLTPILKEERLGLKLKPLNSRMGVGIDIFQAQGLKRHLKCETINDLYEYFKLHSTQESDLAALRRQLVLATYSEAKADKLLSFLVDLAAERPEKELRQQLEESQKAASDKRVASALSSWLNSLKRVQEAEEREEEETAAAAAAALASSSSSDSALSDSEDELAQLIGADAAAAVVAGVDGRVKKKGHTHHHHHHHHAAAAAAAAAAGESESKGDGDGGSGSGGGSSGGDGSGGDGDGDSEGEEDERARRKRLRRARRERARLRERARVEAKQRAEKGQAAQEYIRRCAELQLQPIPKFVRALDQDPAAEPNQLDPELGIHRPLFGITLDLSHYAICKDGATVIAERLRLNTTILSLKLSDNFLNKEGGLAIARAMDLNRSIASLDVRDNNIGTEAAHNLIHACASNRSLRTINLAGNGVEDSICRVLRTALRTNTTLRKIDLSYNNLADTSGRALGEVLAANSSLRQIILKWNKIGTAGAKRIARALRKNTTLRTLDLAWNSIGDVGGMAFSEALANNRTLTHLDLTQNRIGSDGGVVLGESLRFCKLRTLQLGNNPMGDRAVASLLAGVEASSTLTTCGMQSVGYGYEKASHMHKREFDGHKPSGHYTLNLAQPMDHAIAELLRVRAVEAGARWAYPFLDGRPVHIQKQLATWEVPRGGVLEFAFVMAQTGATAASDVPTVHFRLDLALEDDRRMAALLMERARAEEGENIRNETLNGSPLDIPEESAHEWLEQHKEGILDMDYVSTCLMHESRYTLDLSKAPDRAVAYKLLDRVYETWGKPGGDVWNNMKLDGRSTRLETWVRAQVASDGTVLRSSARGVRHSGAKSKWRVPQLGLLQLDHVTQHPQFVHTTQHRFDLGNSEERAAAMDLFVKSCMKPGDNWFNERINGNPFSIKETINQVSNNNVLPFQGILELDYVVTESVNSSTDMVRHRLSLDMADSDQRDTAVVLARRAVEREGEFWVNVCLNSRRWHAPQVEDGVWALPLKGLLEFDFVCYQEFEAISRREFQVLLEELRVPTSQLETVELFRIACRTRKAFHVTSAQLAAMLELTTDPAAQHELLELLAPRLVDGHAAVGRCTQWLLEENDAEALRSWTLYGDWARPVLPCDMPQNAEHQLQHMAMAVERARQAAAMRDSGAVASAGDVSLPRIA